MKTLRYTFLTFIFLNSSYLSFGQNSYGSQCMPGRTVIGLYNGLFIEYISPITWYENKAYARSIQASNVLYPAADSLSRKTTIVIKPMPKANIQEDFESTISKDHLKYENSEITEIKDQSLNSYLPSIKRFDVTDNETSTIRSITYIMIDNRVVTFEYNAPNKEMFNNNLDVYLDIVSSVRFTKI